ncbi:Hypothetical protein CINCED_3A020686 [Cinara cedri]|uniref:ubiquitinyl hydrolase 1 n=1 Tax=Cinara cedri TaxID=506608 RepID=A0A5E4NHU5_9HEMI|nr:Hypothetical protein CINCED_3A020686 [Cinara cedri]
MTVLPKKKVEAKDGEPSTSTHTTSQANSQINTLDEIIKSVENNEKGLSSKQTKRNSHRSPHGNTKNNKGRNKQLNNNSTSSKCESYGNCNTENCGYNSEDEYGGISKPLSDEEWIEQDCIFEKQLNKHGLILKRMKDDGACLFRAVSDQLYGDQDMHDVVRKQCMDYVACNKDYYVQYVTEDFNSYIARKRQERTHGNHVEIHAMSELYNRPVEVYCYDIEPINICNKAHIADDSSPPIRLAYQKGSHYNSIIDPNKNTVGIGLGLPNYAPVVEEKKLLTETVRQSEDYMLEQAMLDDKLRATDWEATNDSIVEQIARESYLQFLKDNDKRNKKDIAKFSTSTTTEPIHKLGSTRNSPSRYSVGLKTPPDSPDRDIENPSYISPTHHLIFLLYSFRYTRMG